MRSAPSHHDIRKQDRNNIILRTGKCRAFFLPLFPRKRQAQNSAVLIPPDCSCVVLQCLPVQILPSALPSLHLPVRSTCCDPGSGQIIELSQLMNFFFFFFRVGLGLVSLEQSSFSLKAGESLLLCLLHGAFSPSSDLICVRQNARCSPPG